MEFVNGIDFDQTEYGIFEKNDFARPYWYWDCDFDWQNRLHQLASASRLKGNPHRVCGEQAPNRFDLQADLYEKMIFGTNLARVSDFAVIHNYPEELCSLLLLENSARIGKMSLVARGLGSRFEKTRLDGRRRKDNLSEKQWFLREVIAKTLELPPESGELSAKLLFGEDAFIEQLAEGLRVLAGRNGKQVRIGYRQLYGNGKREFMKQAEQLGYASFVNAMKTGVPYEDILGN